jgi:nucleoside-diphosphate-sugar epimerase
MKILIVGGTSSVARALKPVCSEFSEVITAGRAHCDITLDLQDAIETMAIPNDIDVVIHTAAHFGGKADAEILEAENINVLGTLKLCQVAVQARAKHFVLVSSISACLKENSEFYSIYALAKKHSEEVARFYCAAHSLSLTILRPSRIYGNEDSFRQHQPFLYTMVDKAEKGEDIPIYGSHDALRNYIHVDDLARIIAKVVQNRLEGTYSCMHTTDLTYSQIARAALLAFESKGNVHFLKDKSDIPDNIFAEDHSLYERIGFYPQVSIEDGMKQLAFYRKSIRS